MAVMLQSANEMSVAVAEEVSGSVKKFTELMNWRAKLFGCKNTHFNNPNGLPDENHYTTASDMAKIAKSAWLNPLFRRYCTKRYYEIPPTNKFAEARQLLNHHKMMKTANIIMKASVAENRLHGCIRQHTCHLLQTRKYNAGSRDPEFYFRGKCLQRYRFSF